LIDSDACLNNRDMSDDRIRTLGLLLTDGFALMSYASVVEAYRAANTLAEEMLYRWVHISVDGNPVRASNGASIIADQAVGQPLACDTLFVFAGGDPSQFADTATFAWLRQIARSGATLAGVSGGPFLLARAGVLDGYRATIHWEHQPSFAECFPDIAIEPGLYVIDRRRVTCAGGIAALDLTIELIEREQGHRLASQVADWFIRTEWRAADRSQRVSLRERYGVTNDRVLQTIAAMEANIEEPSPRADIARNAGVSVRQLERLFRRHLGCSLNQCYLRIRLEHADRLLRTTSMDVTTVAVASGFRSTSHFSRSYKAWHGAAPSRSRLR
jgi:AraC family carnitine catabolism transcriptional activator